MKRVLLILSILALFTWSCTAPAPEIPAPAAPAPLPLETPPPAAAPAPPEIEDGSVPTEMDAATEEEIIFELEATDADSDELVFWATHLPPGATFDPETRTFSWTPSSNQVGVWPNICFYVSDGELSDYECIKITVLSSNRPPVLRPVPLKIVSVGNLVTFTLQASDPDGDELVFSARNLPPGAQFSPPSFSWVPTKTGVWPAILFTVSDGKLKASQRVIIAVKE